MNKVLSKKSIVELHPLSIVKEEDKFIVGREDTEIYILTQKVGVEIIQAIQRHKRVSEIEKSLKKRHGAVDVEGFVEKLKVHGFVKKIDKKFLHYRKKKTKDFFGFISQKNISWLFSKPMYTFYIIMLLLGLASFLMNPNYFPKSQDYFFTGYYILLFPLSFFVSWFFVLLHEFGHYAAAKSLGIKAHFGISNRLHYVVATTSVTNLYSLSRKKRFRVLFGGMAVDFLVIALGFLLLFVSDYFFGFSPIIYKIIKFVILIQFLGILWQFMFFMKTDIYYAFEHWRGIYNLMEKTKQFLKSKLKKTFNPYFLKKEKNTIRVYSAFMVLGMLIVGAIFFLYSLPILVQLFVTSVGNILRGFVALNFSHFYDKLLFLLFFAANQSLLLYSLIKNHSLLKKPGFYIGVLLLFIATNYFVIFFTILLMLVLVKSAFLLYFLAAILGIFACMIFLQIIRKLNKISKFKIIPEVFVAGIAIIYALVLARFSNYFMTSFGIPGKNSLVIGLCYFIGMFIGYMYMYEAMHEKSYRRRVEKYKKSISD